MKIKNLLSIVAGVTLTGIGFAQAQDQPPAPPVPPSPDHASPDKPPGHGPKNFRKGPHADRDFRGEPGKGGFGLDRMLQLTPEQKEKVKAIMEAQKPKIDAIREEERAKMKAVFEEMDKQIRPLLTDEQKAVLDNAKKLRESEAALRENSKADGPSKAAAPNK